MTQETYNQMLARVLALKSEITPGKWEAGCHPANERLNIVKPICFGKYVGKLPECEGGAVYFLHKPNAEAISAIPDMIALIEHQARLIELAREALIDLGACNNPDCIEPNCNRALSQLPAIIAAVEALAQPQELTEDEREEIIYLVQNTYCDTQGKYRDMSIRTVIEAYEAALKAAGCKIVR